MSPPPSSDSEPDPTCRFSSAWMLMSCFIVWNPFVLVGLIGRILCNDFSEGLQIPHCSIPFYSYLINVFLVELFLMTGSFLMLRPFSRRVIRLMLGIIRLLVQLVWLRKFLRSRYFPPMSFFLIVNSPLPFEQFGFQSFRGCCQHLLLLGVLFPRALIMVPVWISFTFT